MRKFQKVEKSSGAVPCELKFYSYFGNSLNWWPLNHEVKLNSKNIGLINRPLQRQPSELFSTLTQASRSPLLLKGWEIKEREVQPFTGSTYETWFEPFSLKVYPYDSKRLRWTKKPLSSVQGMNPLQTWPKNFSSLLPSWQPTSSVFVRKVSAMLEVVVRKKQR